MNKIVYWKKIKGLNIAGVMKTYCSVVKAGLLSPV
jgi:hypothetical protein